MPLKPVVWGDIVPPGRPTKRAKADRSHVVLVQHPMLVLGNIGQVITQCLNHYTVMVILLNQYGLHTHLRPLPLKTVCKSLGRLLNPQRCHHLHPLQPGIFCPWLIAVTRLLGIVIFQHLVNPH
jgi:hypothetical protein